MCVSPRTSTNQTGHWLSIFTYHVFISYVCVVQSVNRSFFRMSCLAFCMANANEDDAGLEYFGFFFNSVCTLLSFGCFLLRLTLVSACLTGSLHGYLYNAVEVWFWFNLLLTLPFLLTTTAMWCDDIKKCIRMAWVKRVKDFHTYAQLKPPQM